MLDSDDTFDALVDGQRRQLLLGLLDRDPHHVPPLSGRSLEVTTADGGLLRTYLSGSFEVDGVDKARIRMHHVHLPKLVEYGFVEWERDAHVVTMGPRFDDVKPLLELLKEHRGGHAEAKIVTRSRE